MEGRTSPGRARARRARWRGRATRRNGGAGRPRRDRPSSRKCRKTVAIPTSALPGDLRPSTPAHAPKTSCARRTPPRVCGQRLLRTVPDQQSPTTRHVGGDVVGAGTVRRGATEAAPGGADAVRRSTPGCSRAARAAKTGELSRRRVAEHTDVRHQFAPLGDTRCIRGTTARAASAPVSPLPASAFEASSAPCTTGDPEVVVVEFPLRGRRRPAGAFAVPCIFVVRVRRQGQIVESRD